MPGSSVARKAPRPIEANTTTSTPKAPRKRPPRYWSLPIGDVKKNACVRYSTSCWTARPITAAITLTPNRPRKATVCASANGEFTNTLPLPNEMLASLKRPPAAAIQSIARAKKTTK